MKEDKPFAKEPRREAVDAAKERVATHSAATAGGAVAGATAGAAGGFAFGPLGSAVGAVAGAVAGAAAGAASGPGPAIDTRRFEAWWREHFAERPYVPAGARYEDYEPAYRYAIREYAMTDHAKDWSEVEDHLGARWALERGASRMPWPDAMPAVRDAWLRMYDPQRFGNDGAPVRA